MTSATLGIGKEDLSYFRNRVGAEDARAVQVGSPFDYERQMRIFVPRKMPDPREEGYEEALAKWVIKLIEQTEGGAFVLFTSYRVMEALATRVRPWIDEKGWPFFVQGDGLPRSRMLSEFKATNNGVLFGTDSFWAGVDVPGQSLRNVIITRLPFGVPDHPLIEARLELIEARGGDAFQDFSMAEAILKFRQGVGRLIRTKTDSGVIAVLDNRIVTKSYGKRFLAALPKCPLEIL